MKRTLAIARIHTVNLATLLGWPLGILAMVFGANYVIYLMVDTLATGGVEVKVTGALASIYFVVAVSHLQSITQVFGFALGLGATRRAFYEATALVAVVQAVVLGLVVTLLAALERATGGWGMSLRFFNFPFLEAENPFLQWLVYTVPFVALSALGGVHRGDLQALGGRPVSSSRVSPRSSRWPVPRC